MSVFPFVYMFHCFLTRLKKILHPSLSPEDRRRSFGGVFCPYSRIVAFFIMFQYFSRITFSLSSQKFLHMLLVLLWNSPCQNKTIALPLWWESCWGISDLFWLISSISWKLLHRSSWDFIQMLLVIIYQ